MSFNVQKLIQAEQVAEENTTQFKNIQKVFGKAEEVQDFDVEIDRIQRQNYY